MLQQPYLFQATSERAKKKGQKRTGKMAEPMPLVGLMDDAGMISEDGVLGVGDGVTWTVLPVTGEAHCSIYR